AVACFRGAIIVAVVIADLLHVAHGVVVGAHIGRGIGPEPGREEGGAIAAGQVVHQGVRAAVHRVNGVEVAEGIAADVVPVVATRGAPSAVGGNAIAPGDELVLRVVVALLQVHLVGHVGGGRGGELGVGHRRVGLQQAGLFVHE